MVATLNMSTPIGIVQTPGEGKRTIEHFYDAVQDRDFDTASRLIHPARLDEVRKTIPTFGRDQSAETYATTREYKNRAITRLTADGDAPARLYEASFDVSDEVPRNRLYESRQGLVKDWGARGLINSESLMTFIMDNLMEFYDVPASAESVVREYIRNRQFGSILDPLFLSEIRRNLIVDAHLELAVRPVQPTTILVWRQFLQNLQLVQDGGEWKIRQGLARPRAVTNYLQTAAP